MIAVDTNVLVRYLVRDDAERAESARILLEGLTSSEPGYICREVAIELVWVLERSYKFGRPDIADIVVELIATDSLIVEVADEVALVAHRYRSGGSDFADLMILAAARRAGARHLRTFDRRLSMEDGALFIEP